MLRCAYACIQWLRQHLCTVGSDDGIEWWKWQCGSGLWSKSDRPRPRATGQPRVTGARWRVDGMRGLAFPADLTSTGATATLFLPPPHCSFIFFYNLSFLSRSLFIDYDFFFTAISYQLRDVYGCPLLLWRVLTSIRPPAREQTNGKGKKRRV